MELDYSREGLVRFSPNFSLQFIFEISAVQAELLLVRFGEAYNETMKTNGREEGESHSSFPACNVQSWYHISAFQLDSWWNGTGEDFKLIAWITV